MMALWLNFMSKWQAPWHGLENPTHLLYECAMQRFPNIPKDRILCIGDSPNHDIKGGRLSGMDTALVRAGIFADWNNVDLYKYCCENDQVAKYVLLSCCV